MGLRPSHLGMCVSDVAAAMRFWCDGLGFEVAESYDLDTTMLPGLAPALEVEAPVVMRSQMIRLADLKIEVISYTEPRATGTPSVSRGAVGLTHLSFLHPSIDDFAQHLVACGGTLLEATRVNVGIEVVFLADPDGTRVELMQG
jgi:catechol 2,3-dioxygenase-like lactoylglutathione lyase family enzyme